MQITEEGLAKIDAAVQLGRIDSKLKKLRKRESYFRKLLEEHEGDVRRLVAEKLHYLELSIKKLEEERMIWSPTNP